MIGTQHISTDAISYRTQAGRPCHFYGVTTKGRPFFTRTPGHGTDAVCPDFSAAGVAEASARSPLDGGGRVSFLDGENDMGQMFWVFVDGSPWLGRMHKFASLGNAAWWACRAFRDGCQVTLVSDTGLTDEFEIFLGQAKRSQP